MTHERCKECIELLLYDELQKDERNETEAHFQECVECRAEYEELKKLHGVLAQYKPVEVTQRMLQEAREGLHMAIRSGQTQVSWWDRLSEFVTEAIVPQYKLAFGAVATIAVGFFLGYMAFKSPAQLPANNQLQVRTAAEVTPVTKEEGQITNVKFVDSGDKNGEVEFTFDAVMPVHMKGSVNDPKIQQVLAHALLNEQNPGVRLRSVNAIASQESFTVDNDVKKALIQALKSDENPGVKKEAMKVLQKFPFDEQVKKAFLDVLLHENNSALRIAAINALDSLKNKSTDREFLEVLKQKTQTDNNEYIRLRTKAILQEIQQ
jgi:anti-sigma factor RsiW